MNNDDKDFIDLDSTANWSKLDVKREIESIEFDKETGKRRDYARGFDLGGPSEQDILLDGLTSGLNYIPEEFLIAADAKRDEEEEALPEEEKPDISWAYRTKSNEVGTATTEERLHTAATNLEKALEEAEPEKEEAQRATDSSDNRTKEQIRYAKEREEAIAKERAQMQAKAQAKLEADEKSKEKAEAEAIIQANIEARKKAREEAAAKQEAIIRANAEARKQEEARIAEQTRLEQEKAAEDIYKPVQEGTVDMFSTQMLEIEYIDELASENEALRSTKEERIAASQKNMEAAREYDSWADGNDDDYQPKKKKKKKKPSKGKSNKKYDDYEEELGFFGTVADFFKRRTALDWVVMATGVLVLLAAIGTLGVYSASQKTNQAIDNFIPLGEDMETIGIAGSGKMVAVADASRILAEMAENEAEEVEEPILKEYEEKESDVEGTVAVTMSLTSVKKDLKVKFINSKTKKLVGGHVFQIKLTDSAGKTSTASDDDKDGIIYLNSVVPGKASVAMVELTNDTGVSFATEPVSVTIKQNIEFKKLDVADEIKTENDINPTKEDTGGGIETEGALTDTVEWVESTKKPKNGSKLTKIEVTAIDNLPKTTSKNDRFDLRKWLADYWVIQAHAACEDGNHVKNEGTIVTPATCTSEGTVTYACTVCGIDLGSEIIPKTNHTFENGVCTVCGTPDPSVATPSPIVTCENCTWDAGVVTTEPTCTTKGVKTFTCTVCKNVKTEEIPAAHKFANGVCSVCGATEMAESTPLTSKGQPVYLDEEGTKVATYGDYLKGVKTFYVRSGAEDSNSTEYIYTGWQEINGNTYFYDKNGVPVTGEQVIQGAKYNFDSTGALIKGSGTMGIDVSKWNGNINWTAVKNSGVSFVIIRCGYRGSSSGALIEDPKFKANIQGAQNAGLKVGIYFFSQAISDVEAVEEASMTAQLIKNYRISYPVFLDVEGSGGRGDKIDSATRTTVINAFCQTIKNSGYTPGVYANKTWLQSKMNVGQLNGCKIWLAQYNTSPTYNGHYDLWQYSERGTIGGISGKTDMNLSYLGY